MAFFVKKVDYLGAMVRRLEAKASTMPIMCLDT